MVTNFLHAYLSIRAGLIYVLMICIVSEAFDIRNEKSLTICSNFSFSQCISLKNFGEIKYLIEINMFEN